MTLLSAYPLDATTPIESVEALQTHLVHAVAVELSTIPLYLYPAYSIKTSGYSQWSPGISAFRAIRSVVIEEMLHLCLARNVLTAVGGDVAVYDADVMPVFPSRMWHRTPPLGFALEPATAGLMERIFMPLEQPMASNAPPQPDEYNTLGQFYAAIDDGLQYLDSHVDLWANPRAELQYQRTYWNDDGGGSPIVVKDLATARGAIRTIVEQGEGAKPGDDEVPTDPTDPTPGLDELSHYAKFSRIAAGIDLIGDVWPVPTDPQPADFDFAGPAGDLSRLFDAAYCYVLCLIDALYVTAADPEVAGETSKRYGLERSFIAAMGGLLYPIADLLVRQPLAGGGHAAPGFRFYDFGDAPKKAAVLELCDRALPHFPSLGGDDGVRQLITRLPDVGRLGLGAPSRA